MNKKGAELTIGTIVIIILALIVLVVIALGFTTGWRNLWEKITRLGGGGNTLETLSQACQIACAAPDVDAYCLMAKSYKNESGATVSNTCHELAVLGKISACGDQNVVASCQKVYQVYEAVGQNGFCNGEACNQGTGTASKDKFCKVKFSVIVDGSIAYSKVTCNDLKAKTDAAIKDQITCKIDCTT